MKLAAKVQKKWRPSADCLHFFEDNGLIVKSSHDNLLCLHVVAVDEAEHIHARRHPACRDAIYRVSRQNNAPHHVYDLQGTLAIDDDVAIADESEIIVAVCVPANEHQLEAAGIIRVLSFECVAWIDQQVNVGARQIVDKVQVVEGDFVAAETQGVGAVLLSLEADRQLALGFGIDHGIILIVSMDINFRAVPVDLELGQGSSFTEADDGTVDDTATLKEVEGKTLVVVGRLFGGEGHGLAIVVGNDEQTFHGFDGVAGRSYDFRTSWVHGVEGTSISDISCLSEGVAHEVPAFPFSTCGLAQCDLAAPSVGFARED